MRVIIKKFILLDSQTLWEWEYELWFMNENFNIFPFIYLFEEFKNKKKKTVSHYHNFMGLNLSSRDHKTWKHRW